MPRTVSGGSSDDLNANAVTCRDDAATAGDAVSSGVDHGRGHTAAPVIRQDDESIFQRSEYRFALRKCVKTTNWSFYSDYWNGRF
ncbi:hypothetical protein [Tardiphaga sp.]|uniref:hypothetical protein n=1 Tax=Tardiphaga sp. TaxID=1926292 RepID=UPI002601DCCC|nr:hypothetical protein [Tardiphaga sp.]